MEGHVSRTQDRPTSHRHRARSKRDGVTRRRLSEVHVLEAGRRYVLGRRGDTYYVWQRRRRGEPAEHAWEDNARQEFLWLERQAQARRRRRWLRFLVVLGAVFAYAVAVAAVLFLTRSSTSTEAPPAAPRAATAAGPHVNEDGSFGFTVPEGWTIDVDGARTEVTSPSGTVTVAVGPAPDGPVREASQETLDDLTTGWATARTEAPRERTVSGLPAIAVGGTATDVTGPIRFLSIVVDAGDRNHAIEVAVPRAWDAATFMPDVEEILASFEPIEP
jgi:hypothetical protein